jgi:uncharacterized LabA/DUF88 family protein
MEKSFVMIDAGFLSKVSYRLGDSHYYKYDLLKFSKRLCGKQECIFKKLFFYNAPPFQNFHPTNEERKRKMDYDSFIQKLRRNPEEVIIREGRCQRLRSNDGKYIFKQKGVDTLLTMDLMSLPFENNNVKQVILIATDSDFVPIIKRLRKLGIKVILYTYFDRDRRSIFSTSTQLLHSVDKYVKLTKLDFEDCQLF